MELSLPFLLLTLAWLSGLALAVPALALLVLTLASLRSRAANSGAVSESTGRVAVLVPAHNESTHLLPTLHNLRRQLGPQDRLLVVADNCSDDTAAVARAAGACVVERQHASLRGKGYALAFGVQALRQDPPDVLIVVDADCQVSPGGVQALAARCRHSGHPVQMLDLMVAPAGAGLRTRLMEFAWLLKNQVRPLGSFRLGGACHLMGTGMALPWALTAQARLASGHVAEDMQLGIDLCLAGHPPQFLSEARVVSEFPLAAGVARGQKARWEHGHLQAMREQLPRLVGALLRRPRAALLVMALDLLIPPLALYAGLVLLHALAWGLAVWLWPALQSALAAAALAPLLLCVSILLAWMAHARRVLGLLDLLSVPLYLAWKLPVYLAYALNRRSGWVRTARKV